MGSPKFNPLVDIVSGIIMATTSIPQLIAYAEGVGYSSHRGLSTAGIPLLIWAITTYHPYLNCGITSTTALMIKSDLNGDIYKEQYGENAYIELVAIYTFCIAIMSFLLAITGFGQIMAVSIPQTVRSGFRWGSSIAVLLSAIPNGFLLHGPTELKLAIQQSMSYQTYINSNVFIRTYIPGLVSILQCCLCIINPITLWSIEPAIMFLIGTIFVMTNGAQYCVPFGLAKKIPGIEVIIVTIVTATYSVVSNYNGAIVGTIPIDDDSSISTSTYMLLNVLPINFVLYDINQVKRLLPILIEQVSDGSIIKFIGTIFMYSVVAFLSVVGLASAFEIDDNIVWSPSKELFALSCTDTVSAIVGAAPVGGSLSRSLVARMTGTTSQLTNIVTALCWIYVLPYVSTMLSPIPKAALSAIIVSAVLQGIVYPSDLIQLWTTRQVKGFVNGTIPALIAWTTGIVTATTSPSQGFAFGLALHIISSYLFQSTIIVEKKEKKA